VLLLAADWRRFTVASAGCRSSAVLLAGVYLAQDGRLISRCGGVREIAMLRAIPRMATAVAHTAGTVYQLGREPFLAVVLGHAASHRLLGP